MKVIGHTKAGFNDQYIAIVSHTELEKCANKYYGNDKLKKLEIGAEFDLGAGHDFRGEIKEACRDMVEAMKQFERARATLFKFAIMVGELPQEAPASDEAAA